MRKWAVDSGGVRKLGVKRSLIQGIGIGSSASQMVWGSCAGVTCKYLEQTKQSTRKLVMNPKRWVRMMSSLLEMAGFS